MLNKIYKQAGEGADASSCYKCLDKFFGNFFALTEPEETCEETTKDVNFTIECINSLFKYFADAAQTGV
jgi:hypothetical protein